MKLIICKPLLFVFICFGVVQAAEPRIMRIINFTGHVLIQIGAGGLQRPERLIPGEATDVALDGLLFLEYACWGGSWFQTVRDAVCCTEAVPVDALNEAYEVGNRVLRILPRGRRGYYFVVDEITEAILPQEIPQEALAEEEQDGAGDGLRHRRREEGGAPTEVVSLSPYSAAGKED